LEGLILIDIPNREGKNGDGILTRDGFKEVVETARGDADQDMIEAWALAFLIRAQRSEHDPPLRLESSDETILGHMQHELQNERVPQPHTRAAYVERMARTGTEGTEIEIKVAAKAFGVEILKVDGPFPEPCRGSGTCVAYMKSMPQTSVQIREKAGQGDWYWDEGRLQRGGRLVDRPLQRLRPAVDGAKAPLRIVHISNSHSGGWHYQSVFDCTSTLERIPECDRPVDSDFNSRILAATLQLRSTDDKTTNATQTKRLKPPQVPFFKEIVYGKDNVTTDADVERDYPGLLGTTGHSPMTRGQFFEINKRLGLSEEAVSKLRALWIGGDTAK